MHSFQTPGRPNPKVGGGELSSDPQRSGGRGSCVGHGGSRQGLPLRDPIKKMTSLHEQEQSLLPSSLSLSPRSSSSARRGCGGCILSSTDFAGSRWGLLLLRALPFTAAVTFLCACYGAMGERREEREERETRERDRERETERESQGC